MCKNTLAPGKEGPANAGPDVLPPRLVNPGSSPGLAVISSFCLSAIPPGIMILVMSKTLWQFMNGWGFNGRTTQGCVRAPHSPEGG